MTLEEQLEKLKEKKREIENSIEEVNEKIELERLKKLADGVTVYDLLMVLRKRSKPIDLESVLVYSGVKNTLEEMQRKE